MTTVSVALDSRSYDVLIETHALDRAGELLTPWLKRGRAVIITDSNVAVHQLPKLQAALGNLTQYVITLPAGESTKSWAQLENLTDQLLELEIERGDYIIALGGGVIGDLVGFAASIVKRGCGFIQIPTTLLSQVDSSVGGKTAINSRAGKNLVGAFYQPAFVLIDPNVLDSLPARETAAGYAEVVKYGLISDLNFFDWCETNASALLAGYANARVYAIRHSVAAKAMIVAEDERETNDRRALLNLGHTFGHALEAETGFSDKLLHGEAVAAGMSLALQFSARQGLCSQDEADRVTEHLRTIGLPYDLKSAGITATGDTLVAHMLHDKKMTGGTLPFILCHGIGKAFVDKTVNLTDVAAFLDEVAG